MATFGMLRAQVRQLLGDTLSPYQTSDEDILLYLIQGEQEVAKRTGCLKAWQTGELVAEESVYQLPWWVDRVIFVRQENVYLDAKTATDILSIIKRGDDSIGTPLYFVPHRTYIEFFPAPSENYVFTYYTQNRPRQVTSAYDELVVPVHDHLPIVHWAAAHCFSRVDSEVYSASSAKLFLDSFNTMIGDPISAQNFLIHSETPPLNIGGTR